jgi:large subunit ribosomal protein L33
MSERIEVALACAECETRNYRTTRKPAASREGGGGPLTLKKYCPKCNKHTVHKETK